MPDLLSHKEDTQCRSSKKSVRFDENTNKNDNNIENLSNNNNNDGNKSDLNETTEDDDNDELNINLIDNKKNIKIVFNDDLTTSNKVIEKNLNAKMTSTSRTTTTTTASRGFMRNFLKFFRHFRQTNNSHLTSNGECLNELKHSSSQSSIDSNLSNFCICKRNSSSTTTTAATATTVESSTKKKKIKMVKKDEKKDDTDKLNEVENENSLENFRIRKGSNFTRFKTNESKMSLSTSSDDKSKIQINVTDSSTDPTIKNTYLNSFNTSLSKRYIGKKNNLIKDGKLTPSNSNNLLTVQSNVCNSLYPGAHNHRRESFLYRGENELDSYVKLPIRSASIASTSDAHQDELIVTPFAQVLASLKTVRQNFVQINKDPVENKYQINSLTPSISENSSVNDDKTKLIKETLDEIDWCLMQLERMQSFRTISDPATTKFRQLLDKELTQYGEADQIKAFISQTYLDQKEEIELKINEGSNRPLGSHRSDSSINLNRNEDSQQTQNDDLCNTNNRHSERIKSFDESKNSIRSNRLYKNIPQKSFEKCETVVENEPSGLKTENSTLLNDSTRNAQTSLSTTTTRKSLIPTQFNDQTNITSVNDSKTMNSIFLTRSSSHTNEINDEPTGDLYPYGVKTSKPEELDNLMQDLHVWGLDIFLMDELTEHRPLTAVCITIFKQRDLLSKFSICPDVLINYFTELEDHYQAVPYHNKIHAADVTQSMHVLLNSKALESVFNDVEIFAAVFSAAIHDVDHPGLTNQYLINTESELALMYNDDSVLENHHLAVAFKLLQDEKRDIFQNIPRQQRQLLRTIVIDMVRATDMSKHMSLLAELKTMVETKKVAGSGIIELDLYQDRIRVLKNMLHCADLSNPTKPLDIYCKWTDRVMNEFFLQGDRESSQGLEISAMCDRHKACIEKTQVGFIDFIVHPLWESWSELVHPDAQYILDTLEKNRDWYCEQVEKLQDEANNEKAQANVTVNSD